MWELSIEILLLFFAGPVVVISFLSSSLKMLIIAIVKAIEIFIARSHINSIAILLNIFTTLSWA